MELIERVEELAGSFARTLPTGARLALVLPGRDAFLTAFLAGVRAGCNVQVLNPDWPERLRAEVIERLQPDLVVTTPEALPPDAAPAAALSSPSIDIPFYTGFTSGSTGLPKGFVRTQRSWLDSFVSDQAEFGYGAHDIFAVPGSFAHSMPLYGTVRGLYAGAQVLCLGAMRPDRMLDAMIAEGATVLYAVPTQVQTIVEAAERSGATAPTVRLVLTGGAKASEALKARISSVFPEAEFVEFYGASELSYVTVARGGERPPPSSVGRPFSGVRVHILNAANASLPAGEVGQIFVESPFRFLGYALAEGVGALQFSGAFPGAITVGDTGFLDAGGFLHVVGRTDRMIVSAGRNIHPEAVEMVLEQHASVAYAAVFGVDDPLRGKRLVAVIAPQPDAPLPTATTLAQHVAAALPAQSVPRRFLRLDDWPFTMSGKSDFPGIEAKLAAGKLEWVP
jgi:long-chain acyl-CoA synthetase